jgi:hypothetical protein
VNSICPKPEKLLLMSNTHSPAGDRLNRIAGGIDGRRDSDAAVATARGCPAQALDGLQ